MKRRNSIFKKDLKNPENSKAQSLKILIPIINKMNFKHGPINILG